MSANYPRLPTRRASLTQRTSDLSFRPHACVATARNGQRATCAWTASRRCSRAVKTERSSFPAVAKRARWCLQSRRSTKIWPCRPSAAPVDAAALAVRAIVLLEVPAVAIRLPAVLQVAQAVRADPVAPVAQPVRVVLVARVAQAGLAAAGSG